MELTQDQRKYLRTQHLGRLATVRPDGTPQNNPVGFRVDEEGRILIGGQDLGRSQKFKNVQSFPSVAFVVDDLKSTNPWHPRMVEIRGTAEALDDVDPFGPGFSREQLRITPTKVIAFGLDDEAA